MTNTIEDFRHADVIFVIGSNTTEQHPLVAERIIDAKKNRGAKLIVVDPRRTALAGMADIYLPIKPGTDLSLINALCRIILQENLHDKKFINEYTEGFDAWRDSIFVESIKDYEETLGVSKALVYEAARLYATGPNSITGYCMGITQHTNGTNNCLALCHLVMLCGMVGRPFTGLNPLRGQGNVQGSCDMGALPDMLPSYLAVDSPDARSLFSPVWGADTCFDVGLKLTEVLPAVSEGKIKALYIMGENPLVSDPDLGHVAESLRHLDFMVVQDIFMTETAQLADLVLPAACWLEKDGTFTNTERRVQRIRTVCPPVGEALPDWKILVGILNAMGHKVDYESTEDVFNEMRMLSPLYQGMTYDRLEKTQGLCWPCSHEEHPGTSHLHGDGFSRGKGKFTPLIPAYSDEQADKEYPFILTTGRVGVHYHTGTMTRRSWLLDRECPENFVEICPADAKNLGVLERQKVKVISRRGNAFALVHITPAIREGVLFMPFHFSENSANNLTSSLLDPVVKIPSFKASAVRVEKV